MDIKDDEEEEVPSEPKMVKSKTMSSIQESTKVKEDPVWGSFNGSFFENKPTSTSPITNAPPKKCDTSSGK